MLKKTSEGEGCHETKRVSRVDSRDRGYGFAVTGSRTESGGGGESRAVNSRSETSAFEFRLRRHRRHCASDRRTPPIRPRFRRRVYARETPCRQRVLDRGSDGKDARCLYHGIPVSREPRLSNPRTVEGDRKSTRLNSSH